MIESRTFREAFFRNRLAVLGLIGVVLIALTGILAPILREYPSGYGSELYNQPSAKYPLGSDSMGLDIFAEVIWGSRSSFYISLMAVAVASLIGIPAGLISGYYKGWIGEVIDGTVDIFLTLPTLPLMIIIAAVMGPSITNVAIVIGLLAWPSLARITRNATLKISEMQFIEAARSLGINSKAILFKHIFLNIAGPVLVNLTLVMATAVLAESGLSFLGLGDPTTWSWGTILKKAWDAGAIIDTPNPWWWWLSPSLFITLYVVCFNLLGTGINDTLNPKNRED